jgi:hypothetical protein
VYTGGSSTTKAIVTLKRKTTLEVIASKDFDLVVVHCLVPVSDNLFIGNEIEFEAHISFNQPIGLTVSIVEFRYYDGKTGILIEKNMRLTFTDHLLITIVQM